MDKFLKAASRPVGKVDSATGKITMQAPPCPPHIRGQGRLAWEQGWHWNPIAQRFDLPGPNNDGKGGLIRREADNAKKS